MKQRLILLLFLLLQHCMFNPIVREILNLDPNNAKDDILNTLLLLAFVTDRSIPTATITPSTGNIILSNSTIHVVFSKTMDPSTLSATLGSSLSSTWSHTKVLNDTVSLSGNLPVGKITFRLDAKDTFGQSITQINGTYLVLNSNTSIYYVSTLGNDSNSGNLSSAPKQSIQSAISGAIPPAAIFIAVGEYSVDSAVPTSINLVDKVSLYGGYSLDFLSRNPNIYVSKIQDVSTGAVVDTRTIRAGATITRSTVIDGLSIVGSSNLNASGNSFAVHCLNGSPTISNNLIQAGSVSSITTIGIMADASSPVISDNTIFGGRSTTEYTFGIFLQNGASSEIQNNTIDAGIATNNSAHGIYTGPQANNPTIVGNIIYGGSGNISFGLNTSHPSNITLTSNSIDGGIGNTSYAIYHGTGGGNVGSYQSNSLYTSGGTNRYCLFEAGTGSSPLIFNQNRIYNCPTAIYFDQGSVAINSISTINGGTTNGSSYSGNY
ncbi:DUF1565 domain-containing protein [Leptospira ryugenii]|nr:DUF1565 domain-containing protein [Leptospira ryugenii]